MTDPSPVQFALQRFLSAQDEIKDAFKTGDKPSISNYAIYTTGTGVSPNLQMSLDKSLISAKRMLADRLNGLLSAKSKLFSVGLGQGDATIATTKTEQVTTNLISEVNVGGYSIKERETFGGGVSLLVLCLAGIPIGKT